MQLTSQQRAKLVAIAEQQSRRRAKRYLKEHGGAGTAAELDIELAAARQDPEVSKMLARLRRIELEERDLAARDEAKWKSRIISLVARERVAGALASLMDHGNPVAARDTFYEVAGSEEVAEAIEAYGADPTADERAEHFDAHNVDWQGDLEEVFRSICHEAFSAEIAAQRANAWRELKSRATPSGRWAVWEYYRKTMNGDGGLNVAFDDRADAEALLLLAGDYRTSSYSVSLIDTQEEVQHG